MVRASAEALRYRAEAVAERQLREQSSSDLAKDELLTRLKLRTVELEDELRKAEEGHKSLVASVDELSEGKWGLERRADALTVQVAELERTNASLADAVSTKDWQVHLLKEELQERDARIAEMVETRNAEVARSQESFAHLRRAFERAQAEAVAQTEARQRLEVTVDRLNKVIADKAEKISSALEPVHARSISSSLEWHLSRK